MATNDLQKKQDKAEKLREQIRDERSKREAEALRASEAATSIQLDNEIARLEAELATEKALTAATKKAAPPVSSETEVARREAESAQAVAATVETTAEKKKEN